MYDSWVTVGLEDMVDNAMLNIGIDFAPFEAGAGILTDNGTWFVTPDDIQGAAGEDPELRVMVGQFTMVGLGSAVHGTLNFQGKDSAGETYQVLGQDFYYELPAPGALALLGLAGIASSRRRK